MAGEIQFSFQSSKNCYALVRSRTGLIWNTSGGVGAFETYTQANYTSYAISVSEQANSAFYVGAFPGAITAGLYNLVGKQQIGGSAAESDPTVAAGVEQWNGTVLLPLSDLATSGQLGQAIPIRVARGTMITPFHFKLVSSVDHITPFTSGVVSGQILRDNGSFGPLQSGAFTEKGLGYYALQALTSGDLSATMASLCLTANGISGGASDPKDFSFVLQRTSGN